MAYWATYPQEDDWDLVCDSAKKVWLDWAISVLAGDEGECPSFVRELRTTTSDAAQRFVDRVRDAAGLPCLKTPASKALFERTLREARDKGEKRMQERDDALQALTVARAERDSARSVLQLALAAEKLMFDNLTATQKRCSELIDETRALKRELARRDVHNDIP
jgi:hypothetical protein